jgi:hypothetical protein
MINEISASTFLFVLKMLLYMRVSDFNNDDASYFNHS